MSGVLSLSWLSAFHAFNPEEPWCDSVSPAVFSVTLEKGVLGALPLWNRPGGHGVAFSSDGEWRCVQQGDLYQGNRWSATQFARFLHEELQRQTEKQAVRRNPAQDLPSAEEKRTRNSSFGILLWKYLSKASDDPISRFLWKMNWFWTKSPKAFPRSEWVPWTWLFLTLPMGEVDLSWT